MQRKSLNKFLIIIGIVFASILFLINIIFIFRKNIYLNDEISINSYMNDYDYSILEKYINKNYVIDSSESTYSKSDEYEKILINFSKTVTEAFYDTKIKKKEFGNKYIVRKEFRIFSVSDYQFSDDSSKYSHTLNSILDLKSKLNSENVQLLKILDVKVCHYFENYYYLILKVEENNQIAYIEYKVVNEMSSGMLKIENMLYYTEKELESYNSNSIIKRFSASFLEASNKISDSLANELYNDVSKSVVKIEVYKGDSLVDTVNGFFIDSNVIVTTFDIFDIGLFQRYKYKIYANDDKLYTYEGILSFSRNYNVALIKTVQNTGIPVSFQYSPPFDNFDNVAAISYSNIHIGNYIELLPGQMYSFRVTLPLSSKYRGSPLINRDGKVIGINTSIAEDSSVLISVSVLLLANPYSSLSSLEDKEILSTYLVKPNRMEIR